MNNPCHSNPTPPSETPWVTMISLLIAAVLRTSSSFVMMQLSRPLPVDLDEPVLQTCGPTARLPPSRDFAEIGARRSRVRQAAVASNYQKTKLPHRVLAHSLEIARDLVAVCGDGPDQPIALELFVVVRT